MKPHLLKVSLEPESSFNVRLNRGANFYARWHFHPEIELIYIHKGSGTKFIGNDISRFEPGELVLLGSNLEHMWRCDPEYFMNDSKLSAEVSIIYFKKEFLGEGFFGSPELKNINYLLEVAKKGLKIVGDTRLQVQSLIKKIHNATGTSKIILLLKILEIISHTKQKEFINSKYHPLSFDEDEMNRLNNIFHYTLTNFQNDITLDEISKIAHLSPKSFCRYFKSNTRKTYKSFLLEVRISHACNLLLQQDKTIYEVCYESGFNNLSNFNRYFKKIMNRTPMEYRLAYALRREANVV